MKSTPWESRVVTVTPDGAQAPHTSWAGVQRNGNWLHWPAAFSAWLCGKFWSPRGQSCRAAPVPFCSVARAESGASTSRDLWRGSSVPERMLLNVTCFLGTITFPDVPGSVFRIKSLLPCGKEAEDSRRKLLVCLSSVMASLLCTGRPASILFLIFGFYPVTLRSSS